MEKVILIIGTATRKQYQWLRDEVITQGNFPVIFRVPPEKYYYEDAPDTELEFESMHGDPEVGCQESMSEYLYEIDAMLDVMGLRSNVSYRLLVTDRKLHAVLIDQNLWSDREPKPIDTQPDYYGHGLMESISLRVEETLPVYVLGAGEVIEATTWFPGD